MCINKKNIYTSLFVGIFLVVLFKVFQENNKTVVKVIFETELEKILPLKTQAKDWSEVSNQIFERPFFFSREGKLKPQLADDWNYENNYKDLIISLKKNVFFHNGKKLKAEDFVYSIKKLKEINSYLESSIMFDLIKDVKEESDYIVRILLTEANHDFLYFLASSNIKIFPKDIFDNYKKVEGAWVGTGAFKLKEFTNKSIILEKFTDYRDSVKIDELHFVVSNDPKQDLINGKLDLIHIDRKDIDFFSKQKNYTTYSFPILGSFYVGFNLKNKKFSSDFRQALFYMLNRKEIVQNVKIEDELIPKNIIPFGMIGYKSSGSTHNEKKAFEYINKIPKHLLPKKEDLTISLPRNAHPMAVYAAKKISKACVDLGLPELEIKYVQENYGQGKIGDFYTHLNKNKDFNMYIRAVIMSYPSTLFLLKQVFLPESRMNFGGYSNNEVSKNLRKTPESFYSEDLRVYYEKSLKYIEEDIPVIPLANLKNNIVYSNKYPLKVHTMSPAFFLYKDSL
ncbi:ABC transporter substrate-binding protein [bacterium]|nr:ABC transporter substrate-binding protein [bacterium]